MMGLFAKKKDPKEQVREMQRKMRNEIRALDRQVYSIQREEQKVTKEIKEAAKKGDRDVCVVLAKSLLQSRKAVAKIHMSKAQINSVIMCMQEQLATMRMAGSLQKSTQVLQTMQNLVKVVYGFCLQHVTMREMSQEMMKLGIIDELIEETMESIEPADLEEQAQDEVDRILWEVTAGELGKAPAAVTSELEMSKFYAVAHGFQRGIYEDWNDAKRQIDDFPQPVYKKFSSREQAEEYLTARQPKNIESVFPEPNKEKYYAVARGHTVGVFDNYEDVKRYIDGYPQPLHKKFDNLDDAVAYFKKFFFGSVEGDKVNQGKVLPAEGSSKKKEDKGMVYYAVARGHATGVYTSWEECKKQTVGFKGAKFKKFESREEAIMFSEGKTLKQIEEAVGSQKRCASASENNDEVVQKKKKK
ncbi:SNF7 family protein [Dictyocaulus viviparus]|uniref:ribonuclease H n=1 Tax=Dictyocaulus viviparus TaxID=29172 RepID=A0A0D8XPR3_DICVI|nr:SNF7 family protein [Dictyocaulus viviparus]